MSRQLLTLPDLYHDRELHILVASTESRPSWFVDYMRQRRIPVERIDKVYRAFVEGGKVPVTYALNNRCGILTISSPKQDVVERVANELINGLGEVEEPEVIEAIVEAQRYRHQTLRMQLKSKLN